MEIPDVLSQARAILDQSGLNIDATFVSSQGGTVQLVIREGGPCQEQRVEDEVDRPVIHIDNDLALAETAGSDDGAVVVLGKQDENAIRFDMFHGVPADVLHVWLMLLGPQKWWLISQSCKDLLATMMQQLPGLLSRGRYLHLAARSGHRTVVRNLLPGEPQREYERCMDYAACPSCGLPLADKHMGANAAMINVVLDVAREQSIQIPSRALDGAFIRIVIDTGDVALAQSLVNARANPLSWQLDGNAMNMPFATPLLWAASKGFTMMVQFLLDARAEVDRRAPLKSRSVRDRPTALAISASWERSPIVKLLLQRGADPAMLKVIELQSVCDAIGVRRTGAKNQLVSRVKQWRDQA